EPRRTTGGLAVHLRPKELDQFGPALPAPRFGVADPLAVEARQGVRQLVPGHQPLILDQREKLLSHVGRLLARRPHGRPRRSTSSPSPPRGALTLRRIQAAAITYFDGGVRSLPAAPSRPSAARFLVDNRGGPGKMVSNTGQQYGQNA